MRVLLPKVSIFISLGSGVPVDIKRATKILICCRKQCYATFKQQKEYIKIFFEVDLQISTRLEQIP